jgi:hypothetical protein
MTGFGKVFDRLNRRVVMWEVEGESGLSRSGEVEEDVRESSSESEKEKAKKGAWKSLELEFDVELYSSLDSDHPLLLLRLRILQSCSSYTLRRNLLTRL